MSEIKALEALRGIAKQMDEVAAMQSEHGFSPWAIKIANELNHLEAEIAERNDDSALESDVSTDGACSNDGEHATADREHSLESESVREQSESVREQSESVRERHYESQDVTGDVGRVTDEGELLHDTREKLEADVADMAGAEPLYATIIGWLDRQAAITEREFFETACHGCERLGGDGGATLDELRDELRKYIVKTDRLGAVLDDRDAQLADAQEALEAVWSERDQWRDAYRDSERMRLELVKDLEHARKWNDTWRDLVHRYEGLCDGLLDERDAMRGEAS